MTPFNLYLDCLRTSIASFSDQARFIVLRGVPVSVLNRISSDKFILSLPIESDRISISTIRNRSKELIQLLLTPNISGILIWEEYANLITLVSPDLFKSEVIVLYDNLRALFPYEGTLELKHSEFIEEEFLSFDPPSGYSEILTIQGASYIKYTSIPVGVQEIPIFTERKGLVSVEEQDENAQIIDLEQDDIALDLFIATVLSGSEETKAYIIKSKKNNSLKTNIELLEQINIFLNDLGGELEIIHIQKPKQNVSIEETTSNLLLQYWGQESVFRTLSIYADPDVDNSIISISQGEVVQTVINEWRNARSNEIYRDIFLTAPTGAGKSLLFQLPAFYLSSQGEVTIVVSPLISLMKDQVSAIQRDRKFMKISYLNSELSLLERDQIIKDCKAGEIDILYLSPELLLSYRIEYFIGERKLGLLVIDEAHLVTTWGRDFRVDYWFLGNHIRKIRKYYNRLFPIIAVTATAVYGGNNDMVFECVDALYLTTNAHMYIGSVKRSDIGFYIGNTELPKQNYRQEKIRQTVEFIEKAVDTEYKTLVYAPFSTQIDKIYGFLSPRAQVITSKYFGSMPKDAKTYSFDSFLSGTSRIMLATKAFGMGVDIRDIQIVYHHAPSGHLADYIQETGRIARDPNLNGCAIINFTAKDTHFTKTLHGLSAIKTHQIHEVLRKLSKAQTNANSQNLLLSTDDFAHIFPKTDSDELSQKVMTSLMMIEKDFLYKNRFNVIVARPKKLFVKVYARVNYADKNTLSYKYKNAIEEVPSPELNSNGYHVVLINLDHIWMQDFRDINFAVLKAKFYTGELFKDDHIALDPLIRIEYHLDKLPGLSKRDLAKRIDGIRNALSRLDGNYFTEQDLNEELNKYIPEPEIAKSIATLLLSIYASFSKTPGQLYDPDSFIQRRLIKDEYKFRIFSGKYLKEFSRVRTRFEEVFTPDTSNEIHVVRYVKSEGKRNLGLIRLGYLLEILKIGSFEVSGGKSPMVFVRINDPNKVRHTAFNSRYDNSLLNDVYRRHEISNKIFEHFFLNRISDADRWSFIEEYFLGAEIDELFDKFPGNSGKDNSSGFAPFDHINLSTLAEQKINLTASKVHFTSTFYPISGVTLYSDNMLTLDILGVAKTHKISEWVTINPIELHKAINSVRFTIDKTSYRILHSTLENHHKEYMDKFYERDKVAIIKINGQQINLKVDGWIKSYPEEFYKWWLKNSGAVNVSSIEKMRLLLKILELNPSILTADHRRSINK